MVVTDISDCAGAVDDPLLYMCLDKFEGNFSIRSMVILSVGIMSYAAANIIFVTACLQRWLGVWTAT